MANTPTTTQMTDPLAIFSPKTISLQLESGTLEISPIRVKQLAAFTQAIAPLAGDMMQGVEMVELMLKHTEQVISATAIGANLSPQLLGEMPLDALVEIASAVLEVNADFFIQRVIPQLTQKAEHLKQKMTGQAL